MTLQAYSAAGSAASASEAPDDMSDAPYYTCDDVARCVEINQCVGCSDDFTNAP